MGGGGKWVEKGGAEQRRLEVGLWWPAHCGGHTGQVVMRVPTLVRRRAPMSLLKQCILKSNGNNVSAHYIHLPSYLCGE